MINKRRMHELLEVAAPGDKAGRVFDVAMIGLIVLSLFSSILETVQPLYRAAPRLFNGLEAVFVIVFSLEYVLRLWSCTESPRYGSAPFGRVRFALTPMAIIDLFAILPFYLPFAGLDLRYLRAFRLARLVRVAKLGRYSVALQTFGRVFWIKRHELMSSFLCLLLLLIIASCTMYYAEHEAQPQQFSSIPAAAWWAVTTLTTVGYGDVYPITAPGKLVAAVVAILGIGVFALPTGILGAGFMEQLGRRRHPIQTCPNCGARLEEEGSGRMKAEG